MTTSIIFKIDPKLKKAAQARAKKEDISLSSILQFATRSFAEGRLNMGLHGEALVPNKKTARILDRVMKTPSEKLSPRFTNAQDAIKYLRRFYK